MLIQVLSLTQDQINGLPPSERDAIQALVCPSAIFHPCLLRHVPNIAEPVHGRHYCVEKMSWPFCGPQIWCIRELERHARSRGRRTRVFPLGVTITNRVLPSEFLLTLYLHTLKLQTSLFSIRRSLLSATSLAVTSSSDTISPFDFVPTSSRFRTLTDRLSSSSWPTTETRKFKIGMRNGRDP